MKNLARTVSLTAVVAASPALAEPPQYALRYLGDAAKIEGINADGVITGWRLYPSPAESFVVGIDHPYELLPLPDGGYISSYSFDINDAGVVVGYVAGNGLMEATAWYPDGKGGYDLGKVAVNKTSQITQEQVARFQQLLQEAGYRVMSPRATGDHAWYWSAAHNTWLQKHSSGLDGAQWILEYCSGVEYFFVTSSASLMTTFLGVSS